ncbi:zinc finger protein [Macleaya cordata]|uniref:RING-type E3 ubiquitin transferase n=1 Tax=Macleaya cordata TaxID=56857 RepID=A0A200QR23_MACCD|nr:zinc finger protein [Macleaya cordata]
MAGMLPGVECARRRRFHQGGWTDSHNVAGINGRTRRSSFCLYTSNYETHLNSSSSLPRNLSNQHQSFQDEKLEGVVREAKERLDEKLRNQRKSLEPKRPSVKDSRKKSEESGRVLGSVVGGDLQKEVVGFKKSNSSKRFSWVNKLGWKSSNQEECAVCLERFESGEPLVNLPCAHRFHSRCLVPWLETNAHCPCCRLGIMS